MARLDKTLITQDEIMELVQASRDISYTLNMEASIHKAQREIMRPTWGRYLYEEVQAQAKAGTLTLDNEELVEQGKLLLAYVALRNYIPWLSNQIREVGVVSLSTAGVTREQAGYAKIEEEVNATIEQEKRIYEEWLADNANKYPLWRGTYLWHAFCDQGWFDRDRDSREVTDTINSYKHRISFVGGQSSVHKQTGMDLPPGYRHGRRRNY